MGLMGALGAGLTSMKKKGKMSARVKGAAREKKGNGTGSALEEEAGGWRPSP